MAKFTRMGREITLSSKQRSLDKISHSSYPCLYYRMLQTPYRAVQSKEDSLGGLNYMQFSHQVCSCLFILFFQWLPTVSFLLHSLHLPHIFIFFTTPLSFLSTKTSISSFFSSQFLILPLSPTSSFPYFLSFSHHLPQRRPRPRNPLTSYLLMPSVSPIGVDP